MFRPCTNIIFSSQSIHQTFTTPKELAHQSRLSHSSGPHRVEIPEEWTLGAAKSFFFIDFPHGCTLVLYMQLIQTGSMLLLLPFHTVLGITLYEDTGNRRAATHQPLSSNIEVWFSIMNRWALKKNSKQTNQQESPNRDLTEEMADLPC